MNKHIEEMARIINTPCREIIGDGGKGCPLPYECNECMARLLYKAGYRKQEWIRVSDRLPTESGSYLVCRCGSSYFAVLDFSAKYGLFNAFDSLDKKWNAEHAIHVTHWMPLVETPSMEGGE